MSKMNIGVQLYTLRRYLKKPDAVAAVFKRVRELQADTVQVSGMCEIDWRELRKISDDNNLPVCITHVSYKKLVSDLDGVIRDHKILGCDAVGIGMMPLCFRGSDDKIKQFADFLNDTQKKLADSGLSMNYHNHSFEFRKMKNGITVYDYLIENTDRGVCFIPDTFWLAHAGQNPCDYLNRLTGRVNTMHLKDLKRVCALDTMRAVGDGTLPFGDILAAAEKAGCGNAVVELDYSSKPYEALKKSMDYIRTIY